MKEIKLFKFISLSEKQNDITVLGTFMRKYNLILISVLTIII